MQERKCLKCQKEFTSEGNWNRICHSCNKKNETVKNAKVYEVSPAETD